MGLGSDLGCSIRQPAAFCSLFGHKPTTPGPVSVYPGDGHSPHTTWEWPTRMLAYGPLCRYAEDLWPFMQTIMSDAGREKLYFKSPANVSYTYSYIYRYLHLRVHSYSTQTINRMNMRIEFETLKTQNTSMHAQYSTVEQAH